MNTVAQSFVCDTVPSRRRSN